MQHEYQLLVREQHICGAQVHVDVPDRDVAVQVVRRVAPYLPTLLAISASSPYWRGPGHRLRQLPQHGVVALADRGAARPRRDGAPTTTPWSTSSSRRARSPTPGWSTSTSGPARTCPPSSCGCATPARTSRTSCSSRASSAPWSAAPAPTSMRAVRSRTAGTSCCARAAGVRRAPGLEGDLVDLEGDSPQLVAPQLLITRLVHDLRPQLEELGDWEQVLALSEATLTTGSAAARQRRTFGRRGELTDVVDALHRPHPGPRPRAGAARHRARPARAAGGLPRRRLRRGGRCRRRGAAGVRLDVPGAQPHRARAGWSPRNPRCTPSSGHAG